MTITCEMELGRWTVRIDGKFIMHFRWELQARKLTMQLQKAIDK